MLSEAVIIAAIGAVVQITAILWTRRQTKDQLTEVHQVVNSRLDAALEKIRMLEAEARMLKLVLAKAPDALANPPVDS